MPVTKQPNWITCLSLLRAHQWLKNSLLFIPMLAGHVLTKPQLWFTLLLGIASFNLCASSAYIINDLTDKKWDQQHPRKANRPFASGALPGWVGLVFAPVLFLLAVILGLLINVQFLACLLFYFGITCLYSWRLKQLAIIDCLTLAILYTIRMIAGALATDIPLSFWLEAFSIFLFLSLAFLKRYAELHLHHQPVRTLLPGRGYYSTDASMIQSFGLSAGYAAILVMALYLNSDDVLTLYRSPEFIWGTILVVLFWISRLWMQAHRGLMHDDPLVFAITDKTSWFCGGFFTMMLWLSTIDWKVWVSY